MGLLGFGADVDDRPRVLLDSYPLSEQVKPPKRGTGYEAVYGWWRPGTAKKEKGRRDP